MRFAYADPPYFQCARKHYRDHPQADLFDTIEGHQQLVTRLVREYPDGWALSMRSVDLIRLLPHLLPLMPGDVRVAAWVKPFAAFKVNVNPAYTWEPLIFRSSRRRDRTHLTIQDHLAAPITLRRGVTGAKPDRFNRWMLDLLGWRREDTVDDLFPGTAGLTRVLAQAVTELDLHIQEVQAG